MHMNTVKHRRMDDTIKCSRCSKCFFADGFKVDRLGKMLKTCLECNVRSKAERERCKCPHGRQRSVCKDCGGTGICEHGRQRWDCQLCSPDKFCEHGKCKSRHTCVVCDPAGNERRKHIRNAREFSTQPNGWPFEHIIVGSQGRYDTVVGKWKKTFEKLLTDGDIDEGLHTRILCNLKPASPTNVAVS